MLPDIERKLLRILFNFFRQKLRMPTMPELEVKTGRSVEDIRTGLLALEKGNYITWEDKSDTLNIVIIEGWDRDPKISTPTTPPGAVNRYYTEY